MARGPVRLLGFGLEGFALVQYVEHDVFNGRRKAADGFAHCSAAQGVLHVFKVGVEVVGVAPAANELVKSDVADEGGAEGITFGDEGSVVHVVFLWVKLFKLLKSHELLVP